MADTGHTGTRSSRQPSMTPEQVVQMIVQKMEEGDPEVLARISLVMKHRVLQKKEDLKEIEAILMATTRPRE